MAKTLFDPAVPAVASLTALVQPVPGGIVSKPLVHVGPMQVTLFALDAGQAISEHRVPYVGFVQVLDGRLSFTLDGSTHDLGPADWLLMPANAAHALRADVPVRFMLTLLRAEAAQK